MFICEYKHLCTVVAVSQTILTLQIMKLLIGYVGSTIYTLNKLLTLFDLQGQASLPQAKRRAESK